MIRKRNVVLSMCILVLCTQFIPAQEMKDVPIENIRYFEKIRWMENNWSATISPIFIYFIPLPSADKYYKVKAQYKKNRDVGFRLLGNVGNAFFEFDNPQELCKNYWLPIRAFGNINKNAQKETESIDEIEGKYISTNPEKDLSDFEIKLVEEAEKYVGWIDIAYNEDGEHFVTYDEKTATFISDGLFGEEKDRELESKFNVDRNRPFTTTFGVSPYNNDEFTLRVVSYGDCNEKMVLKTRQYELVCTPEVLLIDTGVKCTTRSVNKKFHLYVFTTPDKAASCTELPYEIEFEILERQTKWEEIDGKISMWFKIKTETGVEGWVWGNNLMMNRRRYSDGY